MNGNEMMLKKQALKVLYEGLEFPRSSPEETHFAIDKIL